MSAGNIVRRLRGALGNAVVWGGIWYAAAITVYGVFRFVGLAPASGSWIAVLRGAMMFAVMGGIAGTAFSTFIGLRYRGRRLSEINWITFGIGGGIVTGLFVPGFIFVARLLSGDPFLPVTALLRNGLVGVVFGGFAAAASLRLAQFASPRFPARGPDHGLLGGTDHSGMPDERVVPRREHVGTHKPDD